MEATQTCRQCDAPLEGARRFCAACGQKVEPAREGARRQLALLFCDVIGWTPLANQLDPEITLKLRERYQPLCREAIELFEGRVCETTGDGVMAQVGFPVAHEDDAFRAVRAALRIIEVLKSFNSTEGRELGTELHVRIGVHVGEVVVGDNGVPAGANVNLAARIQDLAEPDSVLLSAATAKFVRGQFELREREPRMVKGYEQPIVTFEVVRPTGAQTRFQAVLQDKLTPCVGRAEELARLGALWKDVREGAARVVVVRGEAGIGKSRLVYQFRKDTLPAADGVTPLHCSPLTQVTALAPVIEMLNASVTRRLDGKSGETTKLDALANMLSEHDRLGPDALPLMAALLSIPGANEDPIRNLSPAGRRTRTLEIMWEWMASSAQRSPLPILVEDVQWADPTTAEFLDRIVREKPKRVLLCVTERSDGDGRWSEETDVRAIALARLTDAEVEAMAADVTGGKTLPPAVLRRIADRSEGVPLYVEEITKLVLESGALRLKEDSYELLGSLDDRALPPTLKGSLVARFDRVGGSRGVAQLGATIGREFSYRLIHAVAGMTGQELRRHLDTLVRSELVLVHGAPPDAIYTFKHALIEEAIYNNMLVEDRARLHEKILNALKAEEPTIADRPEIAAHHAEAAGREDLALEYLLKAGKLAKARKATAEAVEHLEHGLDLLSPAADGRPSTVRHPALRRGLIKKLDEPERANMMLEFEAVIGPAYMSLLGWGADKVETSSRNLRKLATEKGDGARIYQAIWSLWTVDLLRGNLGPALDLARQAQQIAEGAKVPLLQLTAHHAVGYTHFYRGEYEEALRHAAEGLSLFNLPLEKEIADAFEFSSSCALYCYQAEALQMLGRTAEAEKSLHKLRALYDDLRHPPSRAYSLSMQCFFFHGRDDVDDVHRLATETRSLSQVEGFKLWVSVADIFLAWASARRGGNPVAALEKIRAAKTHYDATRTHITELEITSMLAEVLLLAGRPEEVGPAVAAALRVTRPGEVRHYEPELFRFEAQAASKLGDRERARSLYRSAIESANQAGAKTLALRSTAALEHEARL